MFIMFIPRRIFVAMMVLGIVFPLASCAAPPREFARSGFVLGTVCTVRLASGGSEKILDDVFSRLTAIENELTVNKPGSQIDAVNASAGAKSVIVGSDALSIIRRDLDLSSWSNGSFDPTLGPVIKLWAIGTDHARLPSPAEISAATALVGWKDIDVDYAKSTLFLRGKGMELDLGSTTKGFAADEVARIIRTAGVRKALIDLGGNILTVGSRPDGKPWRVGLQNPVTGERGDYIGIASLVDRTMVTSGVYERYFIKDGKRYHHIFNAATGYPVDNGLLSVTIITKKSFDADGFTTAIFTLGREKGMALAIEKGVDLVIVDKDKNVYLSPGVASYFELTDASFSVRK